MDQSIKLLCLNTSIFDENNDKLTALLQDLKPDIIAFQEVTRKVDEAAYDAFISKKPVDQATVDLPYSFFAPNWALMDFRQENFHGKEVFTHDFGGVIEYGNYVKSRYKIIAGQSIFLQKHFSFITDWQSIADHPGEEPRMVQIVDLQINEQLIRIINYHGIWSLDKQDTERTITACQKIKQIAEEVSYPSIICGDFNLFPDTQSMQLFNDTFTNLIEQYNINSTRPKNHSQSNVARNVVDYIFTSKQITVNNFAVIESDVSDHLPLILDFSF